MEGAPLVVEVPAGAAKAPVMQAAVATMEIMEEYILRMKVMIAIGLSSCLEYKQIEVKTSLVVEWRNVDCVMMVLWYQGDHSLIYTVNFILLPVDVAQVRSHCNIANQQV